MNKTLQMLTLQQTLNDATNGLDWEKGMTTNGKIINWKRCAYLECTELIESYPWKHWKNIDASADMANIQIETVDIWHFIMSEALALKSGSIETLAKEIEDIPCFQEFEHHNEVCTKDYYAQIAVVETLIKSLFNDAPLVILIENFIEVAKQSNLNLSSLYTLYIGKNILNKFRQNHGYKEGSYLKIWQGKEDNVSMQHILEQDNNISPEALYQALEEAYPKKK
jgi:dimeric dUTPase (all-alpha-NTP-PPase superfamily)